MPKPKKRNQLADLDEEAKLAVEKITAALIGVDVIALIQLISLPHLNRRLTFAAVVFAAALPLNAFMLVVRLFKIPAGDWYTAGTAGLGTSLTLLGMGAISFYLSLFGGWVFATLVVAGFIVVPITLARKYR